MGNSYKIIGVDFPERGYLLFLQLPLKDKLKYFEIEEQVTELLNVNPMSERQKKLNNILEFLGSNPITKVDKAFKAKYGKGISEYLALTSQT